MMRPKFRFYVIALLAALLTAQPHLYAQDLQPRDLLGNQAAAPDKTPDETREEKKQKTDESVAAPPAQNAKTPEPAASKTEQGKQSVTEEKTYPARYIDEMNGFYDYCLEDSYLSKNHDCECMAAEYIDKRMEMGDEAESADIIGAISQSCSLYASETGTADSLQMDMSELTDEQIEDIQSFYTNCDNNYRMKTSYDCECLAAQYMEKRLEMGRHASRSDILLEINNSCPNVEGSAGHLYTECMRIGAPELLSQKSDEEFCECVANEYAKMYGEYGGGTDSTATVSLHSRARLLCMDLPAGVNIPRGP